MQQIFQPDETIPQTAEGILGYLKKTFPLEGFKAVRNEQQLYRYQGAQEVIDHLSGMLLASNQDT